VAVCSLLCASCSLAFPMADYEDGAGGSGGLDCGEFPDPPIHSLQEGFDDGELSADLAFNGCGSLQNGQVVFEPTGVGSYCWIYNVAARRLTCDAMTIRLEQSGSQELGMQRFIYLNDFATGERMNILQETGGFNSDVITAVDASFDPIEDAWWRLRASRDMLFFETSSDGRQYEIKASGTPPFSMDSVMVQIGAGIWQDIGAPGPVGFDCLNVPPPCGGPP
jgi:hypothetical protein